jgi:hypothetical protein
VVRVRALDAAALRPRAISGLYDVAASFFEVLNAVVNARFSNFVGSTGGRSFEYAPVAPVVFDSWLGLTFFDCPLRVDRHNARGTVDSDTGPVGDLIRGNGGPDNRWDARFSRGDRRMRKPAALVRDDRSDTIEYAD